MCVGLAVFRAAAMGAQDLVFRAQRNEVGVPFVVADGRGRAQACPAAGAVTARENGVARPVLSIQQDSNQTLGLGIVFSIDADSGYFPQDVAALGDFVARDLVHEEDACIAVNANGTLDRPEIRQSEPAQGKGGCVLMLDYLAEKLAIWRDMGGEVGYRPYVWEGTRKAAKALQREPQLRRAVLLLSLGRDADGFGIPSRMIRMMAESGIEAYALYYGVEDVNDPEYQARLLRYGRVSRMPEVTSDQMKALSKGRGDLQRITDETGGQFYPVTPKSAPGVAKEIVSNLRKGCVLTYSPAEGLPQFPFRKIDVRHRPGYYPGIH